MQNPADPIAAASSTKRPRYTYTIPEEARTLPSDPKSITMQPVTLGEEMQALKANHANGQLAFELIKHSIIEVDGKPLRWENAEKDRWMETLSPAIRQLVLVAYDQIHNPSEAVKADFLRGRTVAV